MKKIKFRAWDKVRNEMFYPMRDFQDRKGNFEIDAIDGSFYYVRIGESAGENFELMQYTGLLDKNGTEVYCDDLVIDTNDNVSQVIWNEEEASFELQWKGGSLTIKQPASNLKYCVIVGNAHENPELLEQEK